MKRAPRSRQRHDLYAKYHDYDSEISDLLGECGLEQVGLSLIAGGALGNALDRWRQGAVTDFIDLHWAGYHWPTFNGADIAISAGVSLILLASLMPLISRSAPSSTKLNGGSK